MDEGPSRYLHKKFKKQSSIEPTRTNNNNTFNNNNNNINNNNHQADQTRNLINNNNESVPISQSTNRLNESSANNLTVLNYVKSSISNDYVDNLCASNTTNENSNGSENAFKSAKNHINDNISYHIVSVQNFEFESIKETTTTTSSILSINRDLITQTVAPPATIAPQSQLQSQSQSQSQSQQPQSEKPSSGGKYVCTYCNLACSKPSVLQKHIRAHTNERPYPCISCGFSFKTRSNLYKHCRSRTHANRVMVNKSIEANATEPDVHHASTNEKFIESYRIEQAKDEERYKENVTNDSNVKPKPYKPRFHNAAKNFYENCEPQPQSVVGMDVVSSVQQPPIEGISAKRRLSVDLSEDDELKGGHNEPLNLTSKNRKRCLSEVTEPTSQKSLIKELLLKNLYADNNMQCPHCKMIFQTVTELELHKMRNCKGNTRAGSRYMRSSSVNVASILTQNKNAFDNIQQIHSATFPLKSPGPFLGKTRLVESDKNKSFSFDEFPSSNNDLLVKTSQRFTYSPLGISYDKAKKSPVKLFGGEVKIKTTGETKSFKIDSGGGKEQEKYTAGEFDSKLSENCVVKSTLQSGGTVLQSNPNYNKSDGGVRTSPDVIRVYENASNASVSPSIDLDKSKFNFDTRENFDSNNRVAIRENGLVGSDVNNKTVYNKYPNIMDFSQNAAKLLVPNLKQLNLTIPGVPMPSRFVEAATTLLTVSNNKDNLIKQEELNKPKLSPTPPLYNRKDKWSGEKVQQQQQQQQQQLANAHIININPVNLLVDGKVVRYVPGIPGPVIAETPPEFQSVITSVPKSSRVQRPNILITPVSPPLVAQPPPIDEQQHAAKKNAMEVKSELQSPRSPIAIKTSSTASGAESPARKFARPNSLALKPTTSALKQHHGLTPTMFNQILISPDTPRGAKKYNEHFLHGNYFSYLGLKSSTKPVYCTLNKTQPFYVPHFKKLSMYSEWRQQDNKSDKLYVSAYDSRQKSYRYTIAKQPNVDYIVHSSYKYNSSDLVTSSKEENVKCGSFSSTTGGYDSNDESTYVRGRGRGRFVCEQCGIRCRKPSMLKKHIRTHSHDRPYTCKHCNFSFKTKGNLTKHLKSKAHTKNYAASSGSNSSAQQSGTPSSASETEDSGMDSSDESSTRQQEHEAAYSLLSLSTQKPTTPLNLSTPAISSSPTKLLSPISVITHVDAPPSNFIKTEELLQVTKSIYAKNKILDQSTTVIAPSAFSEVKMSDDSLVKTIDDPNSSTSVSEYLGNKSTTTARPLTLADIATKQEKLDKNSIAKNVATEFLKLATKNEYPNVEDKSFVNAKDVNDFVVKSEENKSCTICMKNFNKPSQLRLHMNIHYLERPFRCETCSVSFRTKGHLQKHERSASHHNKLSSSPALASSEPRPFKCSDCSIAFRIHGHLAKHLRSKMHIMKLECLAKIPFGLYAELERSNSLLTEINTADGDQCLSSLKMLAKKVFINDPNKLNQIEGKGSGKEVIVENNVADS